MNEGIVIINKNVNGASKAIDFFTNKKNILFTDENNDLSEALKNKISNGYDSFIICGGDGTINHFIKIARAKTSNQLSPNFGFVIVTRPEEFNCSETLQVSPLKSFTSLRLPLSPMLVAIFKNPKIIEENGC